MSGDKSVKVLFNGKDQKRIKLPRPVIADVKGVIRTRYGIQSDISLVAIVPDRERQEEYTISSSDDLQDVWEEFTELHVTDKIDSGEITLTKGLRVVFNNDVKRITFPRHDIENIKGVICERFDAENVSLLAVIEGESDKYSITTNDDVKEIWKNTVELHVTGKRKRSDIDMTVSINSERHSINVVPGPRTAVVQKARQELEIINNIEQVDNSFRRMGTIANIAYYAAVATRNQDLQLGTKQLGFTAIEICHAAYNTVQSYVITCGLVNETFHTAIIYLLENDCDRALRMISSLEGTAKECSDKTNDVIAKIEKAGERKMLSEETRRMIMNQRKKAVDFKKEQREKLYELEKLASELEQLQEQTELNRQKVWSVLSKIAGVICHVVLGIGGALASVTPLPIRFVSQVVSLVATGFSGMAADKDKEDRENEAAERMRKEKALEKKAEAEKQKLQLKHDLQELQRDIKDAKKNDKCLHILGGELFKIQTDLLTMMSFFEELRLFCWAIKIAEKQIMSTMEPSQPAEGGDVKQVNCKELFEKEGFKEQLVYYMAKWVAIKEACLECRDTLKNTKRELHDHIEKNPTEDEAWRDIDSMIEDIRKNL